LVDAPCSGTGTLGRNPEIRWTLRAEDLAELHSRQVALLRSGLAQLEPGGRLVYSTCSLELEENELVIREAMAGSGEFRLLGRGETAKALAPHFLQDGSLGADLDEDATLKRAATKASFIDEWGAFRAWPATHFTDGFFAVAIERGRTS
jgi:16S rRNA (cytosine967-C5)-methyltransferase